MAANDPRVELWRKGRSRGLVIALCGLGVLAAGITSLIVKGGEPRLWMFWVLGGGLVVGGLAIRVQCSRLLTRAEDSREP